MTNGRIAFATAADGQTLNLKRWEFSCPSNFIGGSPESSTRGLLVGKLLVGGLAVLHLPQWPTGAGDETRSWYRFRQP